MEVKRIRGHQGGRSYSTGPKRDLCLALSILEQVRERMKQFRAHSHARHKANRQYRCKSKPPSPLGSKRAPQKALALLAACILLLMLLPLNWTDPTWHVPSTPLRVSRSIAHSTFSQTLSLSLSLCTVYLQTSICRAAMSIQSTSLHRLSIG